MKRLFDIAISLVALILLSPIFLAVAFLVRLKLGSPVVFRQARPGLHGRPFTLLKFRTMRYALDKAGRPLPDSERLTAFGRRLRSTSLDELPELWNVLKGDMSLVGPRPLLVQYLERYDADQARRHDVRPGLTGWAQVKGRNALNWPEKLTLDTWYVDNRSMMLDLKIMAMTLRQLFVREGISHEGSETMPEFMGTRESRSTLGKPSQGAK
jgi:lipopolysaccharide/colanic/teichoic acid biosynthesis glycosyltransferase